MDCSLPGSSDQEDSPGKNTRVGCHALLQGIFQIQGSYSGLLHYRCILYCLSHQGSPSWQSDVLIWKNDWCSKHFSGYLLSQNWHFLFLFLFFSIFSFPFFKKIKKNLSPFTLPSPIHRGGYFMTLGHWPQLTGSELDSRLKGSCKMLFLPQHCSDILSLSLGYSSIGRERNQKPVKSHLLPLLLFIFNERLDRGRREEKKERGTEVREVGGENNLGRGEREEKKKRREKEEELEKEREMACQFLQFSFNEFSILDSIFRVYWGLAGVFSTLCTSLSFLKAYPQLFMKITLKTNKDLLYSTVNCTQYSVMIKWEKNLKKSGYMYMYNWVTLLYSRK